MKAKGTQLAGAAMLISALTTAGALADSTAETRSRTNAAPDPAPAATAEVRPAAGDGASPQASDSQKQAPNAAVDQPTPAAETAVSNDGKTPEIKAATPSEGQAKPAVATDGAAAAAAVAQPEAIAASERTASSALNDLVRIYAGLEVGEDSALFDVTKSPAWQRYHRRIDATWGRGAERRFPQIEAFRDQWLPPETRKGRDLIYPFAGADFLYADLFFPDAPNTYMFGLEPLGAMPGRERLTSAYYNGVIESTQDLLQLTFFRTNGMRDDFKRNGTVPLLNYFIVRRGHRIEEVTYFMLDASGIPVATEVGGASGARIAFSDGRTGERRYVWYWTGDISDAALAQKPAMKRYIENLPQSNLYMKAASYLCYHSYLKETCTTFRDHALLSLQEDSGMPLRFFPVEEWDRKFFGKYVYPLSLFSNGIYRQNDALKREFSKPAQVFPLPFPLGYHSSARADNLMLAVRRVVQTDAAGPATQTAAGLADRLARMGERGGRWGLIPVADWVIRESRGPEVTASASSQLPPWKGYTFYPSNVLDGRLATSWQPAKTANGGVGQWVMLTISPPAMIAGIRLGNGFQHTSKLGNLYWMNNRIQSATLSFSDGSSVNIQVPDQPEIHTFWLDPPRPLSWVMLRVDAIYRGSTWNDLAISEFNVIFSGRKGM